MATFQMPEFDLPKFDLPKMPTVDTDRLLAVLRDAAYVVIGFGVLTVQQLQVRRRELADTLGDNPVVKQLGLSKEQLDEIVRTVETSVAALDDRIDAIEAKIDARMETAIAQLEQRLPDQAGAALAQAHEFAKAARKQVRGLIRNAA